MFSQQSKHIIALVFLTAFVFIKASGLHAFFHDTHSDQAQKCVLCHMVNRDNATPVITFGNSVQLEQFVEQDFAIVVNHYENISSEKPAFCELFNKPPPFYTVS